MRKTVNHLLQLFRLHLFEHIDELPVHLPVMFTRRFN